MISIVVGMYNEAEVLPAFLNTFFKHIKLSEPYELLLINDGSRDSTEKIAKKFRSKHKQMRIISYHPNKGLGNALRTGFAHAKGRIIVTMDADLAHHPKYIASLVALLDKGNDMVIGSRYVKGGGIDEVPLGRRMLSELTNLLTRLALLTSVKDLTNGFRAYNAKTLKSLTTRSKGFDIEVEILVKYLKRKRRIKEIPVRAPVDREAGESKFNVVKDSAAYVRGICRAMALRWS